MSVYQRILEKYDRYTLEVVLLTGHTWELWVRTLLDQPLRRIEILEVLLCFQAVQELLQRRVVAGPLGDVGTAWQ